MSFETLGLAPELLRAVAAEGYTEPTPVQAAGHPARARGSRRPRRRPDRHRQDGRLRAADPPAAQRHPARGTPSASRHPPWRRLGGDRRSERLPDPLPRPHARPASSRSRSRSSSRPTASDDPSARRRSTAASATTRSSRPSRAGPRSSSRRPAGSSTSPSRARSTFVGRDPRPRRGRPDARHGLHPRHPQDPRPPAGAPPEPAVLGDVRRRRPAARRDAACRSGPGPGRAPQHADRRRSAGRLSRSTGIASASC